MKLVGRVVVEPLSEERLTRIERGVVAGAAEAAARGRGIRASGRSLGRAFVAAAMVAAGVVGWVLHGPPASGPGGAEPAPIRVEAEASRTRLDIGDAKIESDPATAFAVTRPDGGVLVEMTRGKVELEVGKRGTRPPLVVRAGQTDVIVVGTHFTVDYGDGHGDVEVRVTEGVVRVVHQQQETRVAAGQVWQTRAGLVARADRDGEAGRAHPQDSPQATPQPAPQGSGDGAAGSAAARGREDAVVALGQAPDVLRDRRAVIPDAPSAPVAQSARSTTAKLAGGDAVRPREGTRPSHPPGDLKTAIRAQHVEPALDLGEPNAASAVAKYYDIAAHKSGEEASQAFYSIAVVRHLRLAQNLEALQTLDAYIRRFPGGKEYRAALWLRVRILCLDKIDDRCRAAAYTYLHEDPHGPAAHVAELITLSE